MRRIWTAITAGFLALVAAYAALLPLSHWQADEFFYFAMLRDHGRRVLADRVFGWSPRPFSEYLLYLYGTVVSRLQQPAAGWFMGLLWIAWIASVALGAICCGRPSNRLRLAAVAVLLGAMLTVRPLSEVFFWPAGAVSYLSTLIAVCLGFWMCVDAGVSGWARPWGLALASSLAAASSEVGAMFAVGFVIVLTVLTIAASDRRTAYRSLAPMLLPVVIAGFVFWVLLHNRVAVGAPGGVEAPYLRRFWPSLGAGFRLSLGELPVLDYGRDIADVSGAGLVFKLLLFVGWRWIAGAAFGFVSRDGERVRRLLAFCIGLAAAAWGSAFAGYFQFGYGCCTRHWIMRQEFSLLGVAALGVLSALWLAPGFIFARSRAPARIAAAVPFALLLVLAVALRARDLVHDYRLIPLFMRDQAALWSALHHPGPSMTCTLPPRAWIVGDMEIPAGEASMGSNPPWYYQGMMDFFGKTQIRCTGAR